MVIWFTFQIPQRRQQQQQFYSYTQKSKLNNVNEYNSKLRKEFTQTAVSISLLRREVKNVASYKYDSIVQSQAVPQLDSAEKKRTKEKKLFFCNHCGFTDVLACFNHP